MPIHEFECAVCGNTWEDLVWDDLAPPCPACGAADTRRLLSATSASTGRSGPDLPGPGDTACCGSAPGAGNCAGPGSCCGKG